MTKTNFTNFVDTKIGYMESNRVVNREKKIEDFKSKIDILYTNIKGWLKSYTDSGKIQIDESKEIEIFEELLGHYTVPLLMIFIGQDRIEIKPKGTLLIGTSGRVDVIGQAAIRKIILADKKATGSSTQKLSEDDNSKKPNLEWKLASDPPKIIYSKLDKESFSDCLIEVVND